MPWKASSVMEERLRFVARLLDGEGEFRVAYLYRDGDWGKAIFSREVLLDIIGKFIHLESTSTEVLEIHRF